MFRRSIIAIVISLFLAGPVLATHPNLVIERKIVHDGRKIQIVGVDVTNRQGVFFYEMEKQALAQKYRDQLIKEISENVSDSLLDNLIALLEQLIKNQGSGTTPVPNPQPTPVPTPTPTPTPPDNNPTDLDKQVLSQIFNSDKYQCTTCHSSVRKESGLALIDSNGVLSSFDQPYRSWIYLQALSGRMPKNGNKLTDSDLDLLERWVFQ